VSSFVPTKNGSEELGTAACRTAALQCARRRALVYQRFLGPEIAPIEVYQSTSNVTTPYEASVSASLRTAPF
jgi:hypothetical protein